MAQHLHIVPDLDAKLASRKSSGLSFTLCRRFLGHGALGGIPPDVCTTRSIGISVENISNEVGPVKNVSS